MYPVPELLGSEKVTVDPRATSKDFPSSSAWTTVSLVAAGVALLPGGAVLGATAALPGATVALAAGALPSWHALHARSEIDRKARAEQRIISGTCIPR